MIDKFYSTLFTNSRMVWYEEFAEREDMVGFYGHIQQTSASLTQSLGLTFTKTFTIWCPLDTDVIEDDEIINNNVSYIVKFVKDLLVGNNNHKQLIVEKQ